MVGCSLIPERIVTETVYVERPLIHPPMPQPVNFHTPRLRIITKDTIEPEPDNAVFQCFEWNDGQELRISLEQAYTYTRELLTILCSYRKDENEEICKPYVE